MIQALILTLWGLSPGFCIAEINHVVGVEVLIAGPMNDRPESRFGHAMIRLVRDRDNFNDPVITFAASVAPDTDSLTKYYWRGISGGFSITAEVGTLSRALINYWSREERPILRYVIPTNNEIRRRLVQQLQSAVAQPETLGKYWFVGNNCANAALAFLAEGGVTVGNPAIAIPSDIGGVLSHHLVTALPYLETTSPSEMRRRWEHSPNPEAWATVDLQRLYYSVADREHRWVRAQILNAIRARQDRTDLSEVYNLGSLPQSAYELCRVDCDPSAWVRFPVRVQQLYTNSLILKRNFQLVGGGRRMSTAYASTFISTHNQLCRMHQAAFQQAYPGHTCAQ